MKHALRPDEAVTLPEPRWQDDTAIVDFRRWLARVQAGLDAVPAETMARREGGDRSTAAAGESTEFPAPATDTSPRC